MVLQLDFKERHAAAFMITKIRSRVGDIFFFRWGRRGPGGGAYSGYFTAICACTFITCNSIGRGACTFLLPIVLVILLTHLKIKIKTLMPGIKTSLNGIIGACYGVHSYDQYTFIAIACHLKLANITTYLQYRSSPKVLQTDSSESVISVYRPYSYGTISMNKLSVMLLQEKGRNVAQNGFQLPDRIIRQLRKTKMLDMLLRYIWIHIEPLRMLGLDALLESGLVTCFSRLVPALFNYT